MVDQSVPESLQVSAELEAEFEEALKYKLTDEDIERAQLLLGVDTASRQRELYSVATPDAIRNWALGVGDDNPLYTEEDYGPTTRWGTQIGHGTMAGHVKTPMLGDPVPAEIKAARPRACSAASTSSSPGAHGTGTGRCDPATGSSRSPATRRSTSSSPSSPAARWCRSGATSC